MRVGGGPVDDGVGCVQVRARLGDRAGYALVRSNAETVAVGLGVSDGPWLGIFAMTTVPEARRRGDERRRGRLAPLSPPSSCRF